MEKQNIVYTNRRSKETQNILEKILKTPEEIKVDKNKEQEAQFSAKQTTQHHQKKNKQTFSAIIDDEAVKVANKNRAFNGKVPGFILVKGILAEEND